jgi:hypothetical protein
MSQYAVSLRTVDGLGNVSEAETVYIEADGIPPGPVSNLSVVYDKEDEKFTLTWIDPLAADLKEIRLEWGLTGQALSSATIARGTQVYTIPNIPEDSGKQYTISLRSVDYTGNQSAAAVRTVVASEPPLPPTGVSAVHTANPGELTVSWTASAGASAYEIWYHTENNSAGAAQSPDVSGTSKTLTGLTNGTVYYIWVRAKNAMGTGNFSGSVTGTPKNNVAALDGITVNGQNIAAFSSTVFSGYTATVSYDSENVTVAGVPASGSSAAVSYSPAQPMTLALGASQLVTITVTAQNGTIQQNYTVTVTKKKDLSLLIGPEEENIAVEYASTYGTPPELSYAEAEELTFTVTGDYQAVQWFVDGSPKGSGASFTVKARDYLPAPGGKTYTLTIGVTKNGLLYSNDITFKVTP